MNDGEVRARILLNVCVPANEGRLRKHLHGISPTDAMQIVSSSSSSHRWLAMALERSRARLSQFDLDKSLKATEKLSLEMLQTERFPGLTDLESQAPWILFATSKPPLVEYSAVVGTRAHTSAGAHIVTEIVQRMGDGQGLVSGGARGVDLNAHNQAKNQGLPQLMVLASGMDSVFPNAAAEFIRSGFLGAAISELPPGIGSGKIGYLNRNRLIAAICQELYLVEAPEISGSINTAQHALSLGRVVNVCLDDNPDYSPGGRWFAKKPGVRTEAFD